MLLLLFIIQFLIIIDKTNVEAAIIKTILRDIPPSNYERVASLTTYDWCDCGLDGNVTVSLSSVEPNTTVFFQFDEPKDEIRWSCNGGKDEQITKMISSYAVWSLQVTTSSKPFCSKPTSRLRWNAWQPSENTSTPFVSRQHGYACLKIPVLLRTEKNSLLAFAEARKDNCSDFAHTDLLVRRSTGTRR